ncbi:MAG TPA: hypothetical protein VJS38_13350 [Phenylobacterium sp.]|uniref:hypothetical protein n=1 Tax=Phenylobacterium sp. TaxID=1871053 RepID=UPI002B4955C3|nr:hypothetical protein [Phenylobacterium sp.]HKR89151.1 hypothetical protein [Phenylobacterium sp.]
MRLLLAAGLIGATLASAGTAQAQPAGASATTDDARCLLAMVALSNVEDQNAQHLAQGGIVYFTGRIAGREPNYDFARLKALANTMDMKAAQTDLQQRCVPMFKASMQKVEAALAAPAGATPPAKPPATPPGH